MLTIENATETTLNPVMLAAIAAAAKGDKGDIRPGKHAVDVTVRVRGTVNKGEDYVSTSPASINPWALAGFLFSKLNATTADSVAEYVAEAYKSGDDFKAYKKYAEDALAKVAASTTMVKSGRTDCKVTIELV